MSYSEELLSVAEVLEMVPGPESNPTWVSGVVARVKNILSTFTGGSGAPMQIITLQDVEGSALLSMTLFQPPPKNFGQGDTIEIFGGGIRRTIYKGLQQITISTKTQIHKIASAPLPNPLPFPNTPIAEVEKPNKDYIPGKLADPPACHGMSDECVNKLAMFACAIRSASLPKSPLWREAMEMLSEWRRITGR